MVGSTSQRTRKPLSEAQKQRKRDRERMRYQQKLLSRNDKRSAENNEHSINNDATSCHSMEIEFLNVVCEGDKVVQCDLPSNLNASTHEQRSVAHYLGLPTEKCSKCAAIVWKEERVKTTHKKNISYFICCKSGRVSLPPLKKTPKALDTLLNCQNSGRKGKRFRDKIRTFNSMFAFTSIGAKIDYKILNGKGPYTFRIHGQNYHRIGSLLPEVGCRPKYAQLYIYDTEHEIENRLSSLGDKHDVADCDSKIVEILLRVLDKNNKYVKKFRFVRDWYKENKDAKFSMRIIEDRNRKGVQYSKPISTEVAALMVDDVVFPSDARDVILNDRNKGYHRISETHPAYMPLQYPLLFPYGEDSWHKYIEGNDTNRKRNRVTMQDFYAYRLQQRSYEGTTLLRGGKLLQQYIVDAYASVEEQRLRFFRYNQKQLRCELYQGLKDAIDDGDTNACMVGKKIILPSSFTGGPRYMIQNYQDAMAICAWAGPPDIFITFTCNPNWKEIREFLIATGGQSANNRPDVVARVFHLKLMQFLDDLIKHRFFGRVVADLSVVEFQKRRLPHSHVLITLEKKRKIRLPRDIDYIIRAEIPDIETEPLLHELVVTHMIHGPCGVFNPKCACMVNNKCSKKFPKEFNDRTVIDDRGYAIYRRRKLNSYNVSGKEIDNSWVVPYNAKLLLKYQCHINVEICNHRRAIKYLFKYVNKGPDFATAIVYQDGAEKYDEIKLYLDSRYIAASEASWRLFQFNLSRRHPAVQRLQYHLPGEQMVLFREDGSVQEIIESERANKTMLTEWFTINVEFPRARKYTYVEFPLHFVWDKSILHWKQRKRGFAIGRLPYAHPAAGERYYLRMLLMVLRGKVSFSDMKIINGIEHETYKAACIALGLLDDDNEWHLAITEASNWATPNQLRRMFSTMLLFNEVANPRELWDSHWKAMSDDYERRLEKLYPDLHIILNDDQLKDYALHDIDIILSYNGKSLRDFSHMPLPTSSRLHTDNKLIFEEQNYDHSELLIEASKLEYGLNNDQRTVFNAVISSCERNVGGLFFVYGGGGTGKTYLWNAILAKLRSERKIALAVASSGIASLLLPGGRTAHSRFKIPMDLHELSLCCVTRKSNLASLIREAALVIWDEAPMMNRFAFDAVDRTFRDILSGDNAELENKPFGGKTVILGGDFRQILPVVCKGRRQQIVSATFHKSPLWEQCEMFVLKKNMRVHMDVTAREDSEKFAKWLIDIGNGDVKGINVGNDCDGSWIEIPDAMLANPSFGINGLISDVYTDLHCNYNDPQYLKVRAILACRNEEVDEINMQVVSQIEEESRTYLSADTTVPVGDDSNKNDFLHTPEFLNCLKCSGLPPHSLELKVNIPIMLLRNLDQSIGLCNGTRLIIEKLGERVIKAKIMTGTNIGKCVAIPRIIMTSDREDMPFIIKRRQFPVRVAYAMTINKSQGQTLERVGLYLRTPVFCHGQLYVAFSRATCASALKVLIEEQADIPKNCTQNVVYKEVLQSVAEKLRKGVMISLYD